MSGISGERESSKRRRTRSLPPGGGGDGGELVVNNGSKVRTRSGEGEEIDKTRVKEEGDVANHGMEGVAGVECDNNEDRCVNCNKLIQDTSNSNDSSRVCKIVRADGGEMQEVNVAEALKSTFTVSFEGDLSTSKCFLCGRCGQLLELAFNAFQDFLQLTKEESMLSSRLAETGRVFRKYPVKSNTVTKMPSKPPPPSSASRKSHRIQARTRKTSTPPTNKLLRFLPIFSSPPTTRYMCTLCNKSFPSTAVLKKHEKIFHKKSSHLQRKAPDPVQDIKKEEEAPEVGGGTNQNEEEVLAYRCTLCEQEFLGEEEFREHLSLHEESTTPKATTSPEESLYFRCKLCHSKKYSTINDLMSHYSDKHPLVRVLNATTSVKLKKDGGTSGGGMHMKSGKVIFKCEVCDKLFSRQDHMKLHLRIHTGEKPFVCKLCTKAFSDPRGLAYHEITHSNERPYCCMVCGLTFKRLHHLNDHEKNHNAVIPRPFTCPVCRKAFKCKKHLNSHSVIHEGTKEHKCDLCFKAFNRKDNLRQHLKKVHGKNNSPAPSGQENKEKTEPPPPTSSTSIITTTINLNNAEVPPSSSAVPGGDTTSTITIPVAIAVTDQQAIDQIVYMHL